jgi:hypothetical protein
MADLEIGVLAEDENDCDVVAVLVRRILASENEDLRPGQYKVHRRSDNGCSKLRKRAERWMRDLSDRGCRGLILLHDRDDAEEAGLHRDLSGIPVPQGVRRLVCIPVEEIEAWFFSSSAVLHAVVGPQARVEASPHLISDPKGRLIHLSRRANRRPRYSPNDNPRWAELLELDACARRCRAFRALKEFVEELWQASSTARAP